MKKKGGVLSPEAMENLELILMSGIAFVGGLGAFGYYFLGRRAKALPSPAAPKVPALSDALLKSKRKLWLRSGSNDEEQVGSLEELEEALYMADIGPETVGHLIEKVSQDTKGQDFDLDQVKGAFKSHMLELFENDQAEQILDRTLKGVGEQQGPYVISIVGINGAGKTTTIGKLAYRFSQAGKKVMVAAGDTFRAAAESQLGVWAERTDSLIFIASESTKDPGAVAFQAYEKAKKEQVDILIVDTAGRLHTQDHLMKELEKVGRVLKKHDGEAPHEVWMVLDANTGRNAFYQAEAFHKTLGLTAFIMTKVDGSTKAGTALGIRHALGVPIFMLGIGEQKEDLKLFDQNEFVDSLV